MRACPRTSRGAELLEVVEIADGLPRECRTHVLGAGLVGVEGVEHGSQGTLMVRITYGALALYAGQAAFAAVA